ncbi:MAG TPA: hypothetical protein VH518_00720 [Tepidisphaeraceae bacterium]
MRNFAKVSFQAKGSKNQQAVLACEPLENRRLLSLTAPQLDSLPGAPVKLYLDFVGSPAFQWDSTVAHGPGSNSTPIPAFSYDADVNNFSGAELNLINAIWQTVAEKYSPFNINVSTVPPSAGVVQKGISCVIVIGGSVNDWYQQSASGVSKLNGFTDPNQSSFGFMWSGGYTGLDQVSFVHFCGETAAHEAGHLFGLNHQSLIDGSNNVTVEYSAGTINEAPIMGKSNNQYGKNGIWWSGASSARNNNGVPIYQGQQDDLAVLTRPGNNITYRSPVGGGSLSIDPNGAVTPGSGMLPLTSSFVQYNFTPTIPQVTLNIDNARFGGMLGPSASLLFNGHTGSANLSLSRTRATLTCTGLQAGQTYTLRVASAGGYGEIGQFTVSGLEPMPDIAYYDGSTRTMVVTGQSGNNNVELFGDATSMTVIDTANGIQSSAHFPTADVDHISLDLGSGNDIITIDHPLTYFLGGTFHVGPDVIANAGLGNNTLQLKSVVGGGGDPATFNFDIQSHIVGSGPNGTFFENVNLNGTNVSFFDDLFQRVDLFGGGGLVATNYNLHAWGTDARLYVHGTDHVDNLNVDTSVADNAGALITFDGGGGVSSDTFTIDDSNNAGGLPDGAGEDITFVPKTFSITSTSIFTDAIGGFHEFDYSSITNIKIYLGRGMPLGDGTSVSIDSEDASQNIYVYGNANDDSFNTYTIGDTDPHGFPELSSPFSDFIHGNIYLYGNAGANNLTIDDRDRASSGSYSINSFLFHSNSGGGTVSWDGVNFPEVDFYGPNAGSNVTAIGLDSPVPMRLFGGTSQNDVLNVDDHLMANRVPNRIDLMNDPLLPGSSTFRRYFSSSPTFEDLYFSGYEAINVATHASETQHNITGTPALPAGQQVTFTASSGADTFNVTPRDAAGNPTVLGNIGIIGGSGSDILNLTDTLASTGTTWTVSNPFDATTQDFAVAGGALVGALNDVETLALYGSGGDDTFNVNTFKAGTSFNINAGDGNDTVNFGNNNLVNNITSISQFTFDGQGGSDTFNLNSTGDFTGTYTAAAGSISYVPSLGSYSLGLSIVSTELRQLLLGNATVNVPSAAPGTTTALFAGSNGTTLTVGSGNTLSAIHGGITFDGGPTAANGATINVNDSADTVGRIAHLTQNTLGAFPGDTLFPAGGSLSFMRTKAGFVPGLTLNLGSGADTIYAQPNATGTATITGGSPTATPGDTLNLALAAAQNFTVNGTPASGSVTSSNLKTLSYSGFETGPTVDSVAPAAVNGNINLDGIVVNESAERRQAFEVQFSENLGSVSPAALQLTNLTTGQAVPTANIAVAFDPVTHTAHFTFPGYPGGILPDGNYHGVILASGTADAFGNPMSADASFDFFFLEGDANHDRTVDATDLGIISANWQQSARVFSQGDFNYDGIVDVNDLDILGKHWQQTLALPAASPIPNPGKPKQRPQPISELVDTPEPAIIL